MVWNSIINHLISYADIIPTLNARKSHRSCLLNIQFPKRAFSKKRGAKNSGGWIKEIHLGVDLFQSKYGGPIDLARYVVRWIFLDFLEGIFLEFQVRETQ
jgi:hypothetical protein